MVLKSNEEFSIILMHFIVFKSYLLIHSCSLCKLMAVAGYVDKQLDDCQGDVTKKQ